MNCTTIRALVNNPKEEIFEAVLFNYILDICYSQLEQSQNKHIATGKEVQWNTDYLAE